jgi:hemin uptake protein HemP
MSIKPNTVALLVFAGMFFTSADLFLSQNQLCINFNGEKILLKSTEYPFAFHILPFVLITFGSLLVLIFIKALFQKDK